ncbi:MAG TPA: formate/nitrite transporter family protein [Chloroflexota bacterium]|nr:formate/nitrite transporter family protein [Chloroflexota bacterium]
MRPALPRQSYASGRAPRAPADDILEQQPEQIAERAADVGAERLERTWFDIFVTGVIGGVEVSLGGLAAMNVLGALLKAAPGLGLDGALAAAGMVFPAGFLFVILGRSELFTENFLIPVVAVLTRERNVRSLLMLWALSLVGNLLGAALLALLLLVPHAIGDQIRLGYGAYSSYKLALPGPALFASACLAGIVMTVLTWLVIAVSNPVAKVLVIFAAGYTLFATNLSHVVVSGAIIFVGYHNTGHTILDVGRWIGIATAGNVAGGVGFVTFFRLAQAWEKNRQAV